jgi:hypothetical protein
MAWIEHLRRSDPNYDLNAQQVPFGIQLRRVRAASQNPPLAKLRHFIADSGHRFITAQAQGKSVLAPDPLIPLVKDTAGFRIVQEGRTVSYYLFPETYEAEAVPDRWTAGQARLQLAHSGDIVSRGCRTSCKVSRLLMSPYGLVSKRVIVVDAAKFGPHYPSSVAIHGS